MTAEGLPSGRRGVTVAVCVRLKSVAAVGGIGAGSGFASCRFRFAVAAGCDVRL